MVSFKRTEVSCNTKGMKPLLFIKNNNNKLNSCIHLCLNTEVLNRSISESEYFFKIRENISHLKELGAIHYYNYLNVQFFSVFPICIDMMLWSATHYSIEEEEKKKKKKKN